MSISGFVDTILVSTLQTTVHCPIRVRPGGTRRADTLLPDGTAEIRFWDKGKALETVRSELGWFSAGPVTRQAAGKIVHSVYGWSGVTGLAASETENCK